MFFMLLFFSRLPLTDLIDFAPFRIPTGAQREKKIFEKNKNKKQKQNKDTIKHQKDSQTNKK